MGNITVIGGALLVAGTSVGAGMLGLPLVTAASGFVPSVIGFLLCWLLMTTTAYLMLEASFWFKGEENIISMSRHTLGKGGELLAWISYLTFLYALMCLYTSAGSNIFYGALFAYFPNFITIEFSILLYVLTFAVFVYLGAKAVDTFNRILVFFLMFAYCALVVFVTPKVNSELIVTGDPKYLIAAVPVIVMSFGFHLLIPSLKCLMGFHKRNLCLAIFYGSCIPLAVYLVWEYVVLGVIPLEGSNSLSEIVASKDEVIKLTEVLDDIVGKANISFIIRFFSFFAIVSSYVGVSLGLFDFLADGTKISKKSHGRILLIALTFLPGMAFAMICPGKFLAILGYAGIFASILLIILPSVLVLVGRHKNKSNFVVPGGKILPLITLTLGVLVILIEILAYNQLLPKM